MVKGDKKVLSPLDAFERLNKREARSRSVRKVSGSSSSASTPVDAKEAANALKAAAAGEEGGAKSKSVEQLRDIEKRVLTSAANANGILQLLAHYDPEKHALPVALAALHCLRRVFSRFVDNASLRLTSKSSAGSNSSKKKKKAKSATASQQGKGAGVDGGEAALDTALRQYHDWLRQQYLAFLAASLRWLHFPGLEFQVPVLRTLMHFVTRESEMQSPRKHVGQKPHTANFGHETYLRIVRQLVCGSSTDGGGSSASVGANGTGPGQELLHVLLGEFALVYDDVRLYTQAAVRVLCEQKLAQLQQKQQKQSSSSGMGVSEMGVSEARALLQGCPTPVLVQHCLFLLLPLPPISRADELNKFLVQPRSGGDEDDGQQAGVGSKRKRAATGVVWDVDSDDDGKKVADLADGGGSGSGSGSGGGSSSSSSVRSVHRHKRELGDAWLALLRLPLPSADVYRRVLVHLPRRVMPHMTQPLRLADFFTDSYNARAGSGASDSQSQQHRMLALHGLFLLMHRHGLDCPRFYPRLYALLGPGVFHAPHRARFCELLALFLTSSYLPIYLVAAFAKRLSRLALAAPPAGIMFAAPLVHELLARHPQCRVMIHRPAAGSGKKGGGSKVGAGAGTKAAAASASADPFVASEGDMAKCRALESSLWELHSLTAHYHPDVANLASVFGEKFTDAHTPGATGKVSKGRFKLDDYAHFTYRSLMEQVVGRDAKQRERRAKRAQSKGMDEDEAADAAMKASQTPLAVKEPTALFQPGDIYSGVLEWG